MGFPVPVGDCGTIGFALVEWCSWRCGAVKELPSPPSRLPPCAVDECSLRLALDDKLRGKADTPPLHIKPPTVEVSVYDGDDGIHVCAHVGVWESGPE